MADRRGPPNIDGLITIKVDNIPFGCTADDVRRVFDRYGDIGDVYIPRDHRSNESRGFAFVRFYREKDADYALDEMDGRDFRGRALRCEYAKRRRPEDPKEFYAGRGGSDDRRERRRSRSRDRRRSHSPRRRHSRSRSNDRRRSRDRKDSRSKSPVRARKSESPSERKRSPSPAKETDKEHDKENDGEKNEENGHDDDKKIDEEA